MGIFLECKSWNVHRKRWGRCPLLLPLSYSGFFLNEVASRIFTVNLVFAKPIKSRVKFWQMIGRGTRLCPAIGKTKFRIFDHWGNFEFFSEEFQEADPTPVRSLMQQVFEARIDLAETALDQSDPDLGFG